MKPHYLFCYCSVIFLLASPLQANDETDQLRQQIKLLEARLDAIEKRDAPLVKKDTAPPQPVAVAAPEKKSFNVDYKLGKGLQITSADEKYKVRIGGYFQADNHTFLGNSNPGNNTDQFFIRSARPIIEAKFDKFFARLMLDFSNGQSTLLDAYGDYNASEAFNIRVGKFKLPLGIERWLNESNVLFVERGMTTNLVPYRDNGVELYGDAFPHQLEYHIALTNGSPDLVNGTGNTDNSQTVTARLFAHPFYSTDIASLKGVGFGLAGSFGSHSASLTNPNLTSGYVTSAQSKFFTYATNSFASGNQWRVNPQVTYYKGPFSVLGEYVLENQGVHSGSQQADLRNSAWEAIATYVITGEDARFDGVIPRNNFDVAANHWGAFELVGRAGRLDVDKDTFPLYASLATSASAAQEASVGGTWYLNPAVKINLDFEVTQFDGGNTGNSDRKTEKALLTRTQVKF